MITYKKTTKLLNQTELEDLYTQLQDPDLNQVAIKEFLQLHDDDIVSGTLAIDAIIRKDKAFLEKMFEESLNIFQENIYEEDLTELLNLSGDHETISLVKLFKTGNQYFDIE